ncbi:hypothetical protein, partial [Nodularia sp. UHCC 0506]|uniref:hypothetical protein n=1 Tax=Nodularia sp. UHCC 0506 TaxID=3110243 RepID=UPI002B1EA852
APPKYMKLLGNLALALLFGTMSVTALNPMFKAIAQEASEAPETEMQSPPEPGTNQRIEMGEVEIQIEEEKEVELEPEQSITNTPKPMEESSSD